MSCPREIKIPVMALTAHGGTRVLVAIANALCAEGWKVTVVASNYRAEVPFLIDPRVIVKKVGPLSSSKALSILMFMLLTPVHLMGSNVIANHFLTVIPSWIAKVISGARYVYLVQGVEERFFLRLRQAPLRAICRWTYRRGGLVAANSYLASQLAKYGKVLISLNLGISKPFFSAAEEPPPARIYDVVYFLRRQPIKRLDRFDAILASLKAQGRSVVCISQDKELLSQYQDRVAAVIPQNDSELVAVLDRSKVLLMTSEHEGFALPPLEAMARGVPSVMYECGGPGVYARHGENAFIVHDDSSATAVAAINTLLDDPATYAFMSAHASATAGSFTLAGAVNTFVLFLSDYFNEK